jgi:hypothetical protein
MLEHKIKNEHLHLSLSKKESDYSIPLFKIGRVCNWDVFGVPIKSNVHHEFRNVSHWVHHIATSRGAQVEMFEFASLVEFYDSKIEIDWDATYFALKVFEEFNDQLEIDTNGQFVALKENYLDRQKERSIVAQKVAAKYILL